jgi:hypothetical protein
VPVCESLQYRLFTFSKKNNLRHKGGIFLAEYRNQWHPGYCSAFELRFRENREYLMFDSLQETDLQSAIHIRGYIILNAMAAYQLRLCLPEKLATKKMYGLEV